MLDLFWYFLPVGEIYFESLCVTIIVHVVYMFCSFYLILYMIWFNFSLSLTPFYYFDYYEHQYFTSILCHMFFWLKMHYLDHLFERPIGPSLKALQLRRLFDWTNMAAALPQFFGCTLSLYWGQWLPALAVPPIMLFAAIVISVIQI